MTKQINLFRFVVLQLELIKLAFRSQHWHHRLDRPWGVYLQAAEEPWGQRQSWAGRCPPLFLHLQSEPPPPGDTPPSLPQPAAALSHLEGGWDSERTTVNSKVWNTLLLQCSGASYDMLSTHGTCHSPAYQPDCTVYESK